MSVMFPSGTERTVTREGRPLLHRSPRRRCFFTAVPPMLSIILLGAVPAPVAASAGDVREGSGWRRLAGAGFSVVGTASDGDLRKVRQEIQLFRDSLRALFPSLRLDGPVPLNIVVFKDDRAFTPFKPRSRGKPLDNVAGYFSVHPERTVIVMAPSSSEFTYRIIFHEYTHYLVHLNMRRVPLWLNEGLAEFYGTFRGSSMDGRSQLGRPIAWHVNTLVNGTRPPLRRLLSPDPGDMFRDPAAVGMFYAQSWAFVHYLLLGDNGAHRSQLSAFLALQNSGQPLDAMVTRAFGAPLEQVEREFAAYVKPFSWPVAQVTPARAEGTPPPIEPVGEVDALQEQADLLVWQGAFDEADRLLDKAQALDPAHGGLRLTRARSLLGRDRAADALEALGPVTAAPTQFAVELTRAEALRQLERHEPAVAAYDRALALQPQSAATLFGLSLSYLELGREEAAAAAFGSCVSADPTPVWYSAHAFAVLRMGLDTSVVNDVSEFLRRSPEGDHVYVSLAAALTLMRGNAHDEANRLLDAAAQPLKPNDWPAALIALFRGRISPAQLLARASDQGQLTEAHAYVGVLASIAGRTEEARTHLEWVTAKGLKNYVEYGIAIGELKRLARPTAR
jgi:tetratricopeptide (TPR) repeat protein